MEVEEIIQNVHKLSSEELQKVKVAVEKELSEKRILEIESALKAAKKKASENNLKYYSSGEDLLSAINDA